MAAWSIHGIILRHMWAARVHRHQCSMPFSNKVSTYSTLLPIRCNPPSRVTWDLARELVAFRHSPVSIPKPPHSQRFLPRKAINRLPLAASFPPRINSEPCSTRIPLPVPSESTKIFLPATDRDVAMPSLMVNMDRHRVLRDHREAIEAEVEPIGSRIWLTCSPGIT